MLFLTLFRIQQQNKIKLNRNFDRASCTLNTFNIINLTIFLYKNLALKFKCYFIVTDNWIQN